MVDSPVSSLIRSADVSFLVIPAGRWNQNKKVQPNPNTWLTVAYVQKRKHDMYMSVFELSEIRRKVVEKMKKEEGSLWLQ